MVVALGGLLSLMVTKDTEAQDVHIYRLEELTSS